MKDIIYIFGHKNPDTDSICSAIAYAEFKNKISASKAVPVRLGEINRETQFALNYFDVEVPQLIETVKVQVSDLNIDNTAPVSPDISLKMAWAIMQKNNAKTLPVVDNSGKLTGIASISNLTSSYMDVWNNDILAKSNTSLDNILDTLSARCIYAHGDKPTFKGKIVTIAMHPDNAGKIVEAGDIVLCGDREDSQNLALDCNASLIIITGNLNVTDAVIDKAKSVGCSIISTPYDTFTTSRLITQSIPIGYVMTKNNIVTFSTDDFVEDIKDIMLETRYRSYPVIDEHNNVVGSISRYHLISQHKKRVILLDHNEKTQSVHGLEDAEILEIIDHHRIADVQTGLPIYFRNEPLGSTSTIVASMFFENGIRPSKKTAGLLCSAIISDTLLFKSPTATTVDKIMLNRLAQIANLDVEKYAKELFKAGTSLKNRTLEEIFYQDLKSFTLSNLSVGISQVGTMDMEGFSDIRKDMLDLMERKALENNFNILILMLTDIFRGGSQMLVVGDDKDIVPRAFNSKLVDNSMYLPGILSRKKQVVPPLSSTIASIK